MTWLARSTAVPEHCLLKVVQMASYSNRDPEPNTGQRGMFAREYHLWTAERMTAEEQRRTGKVTGTPSVADAPTTAGVVQPVQDVSAAPPAVASPVPQPEASVAPAPLVNIYPRNQSGSLRLGHGIPVPCFTHSQLERMSAEGGPRVGIRLVASQLRDSIGEAQMAQLGLPPLNIHAHPEVIIDWVLAAQVVLARASGLADVSEESFGVPREDGRSGMNHSQRSAV